MVSGSRRVLGFTLIELMVTLAVILVLAMLALPSFRSFQQRSALRGAAEQTVSFWNQARFEAAKRNAMVKVGVKVSGSNFCLGATTTTNAADTTSCDCLTANQCNVAIFPVIGGQSEWNGVTYLVASGTTPTLGGGNAVAVIEPMRTALATSSQAGLITLMAPTGSKSYRMNVKFDAFGRAVPCESNLSPDKMSDFNNRRCDP
jgi:prepilin-type N-terminal cleavage/methylation domain-containing protein